MNVLHSPMRRKATGLSWAAEIPSNWDIRRGKFLFDLHKRPVRPDDDIVTAFRDGQVTLRKNRRTDGFTNALKETGYQGVRKGDLVIHAMDAFAGAVGVSDSDGKCTPVYSCCTPKSEISVDFYGRMIRAMALSGFIESLAKGIRERSTDFRWREFAEQSLPVPPYDDQIAIVSFLDRETTRIDTLIEKKARFIELLKEKRAAVITHAVTKGLDPDVPMKDSGAEWLGDVPAVWTVGRLRDFCLRISTGPFGSTINTSSYIDGGVPILNPSHFADGKFQPGVGISVDVSMAKRLSFWALSEGDLIVARRGELGRCAVARTENVGWICGTGSMVVSPDPKVLLHDLAFFIIGSAYARAWLEWQSVGSTMPNLNETLLGNLPVTLPKSLDQQKMIVSAIERRTQNVDTLITKTERSIDLLREKRSALITAAVTGKIDVREAA